MKNLFGKKHNVLGSATAVLVLASGATGLTLILNQFRSELRQPSPTQLLAQAEEPNTPISGTPFSKVGYLLSWEDQPQATLYNWTLMYQQARAEAYDETLIFNEDSRCVIDDRSGPCDPGDLHNGDVVKVEGTQNEDQIVVKELAIVQLGGESP
jgi:hypothetical protein